VSNTERLNRAIGLPAVRFTTRADGRRVRRFAEARKSGLVGRWEEHPFEWVEERRFGVLREFSRGPFAWITSAVELTPCDGGTKLTHTFRLVSRGWFGKVIAAVELGVRTRRALDRVYRRIDAILTKTDSSLTDHFEDSSKLSGGRLRRLETALARLAERGVAPAVVEGLGDFLVHSTDQSVARIRPLNVASRLALDPGQFVDACLLAATEGLLVLMWDILCPICRIPTQIHDSLKAIREHGHCEACNLDFDLDFANSVEMIFRVHPEIRPSELGTFCIGGPAHSPHVAAQVRIAAGERIVLALGLGEGAYRLCGPQLPYVIDFRVVPGARTRRWDFPLSHRPANDLPLVLVDGDQTLALTNDSDQELVVRVERTAPRSDALTAARAAALPLFRELFPNERLAPGTLVSVSHVTLLVTDLAGVGRLYQEQGDAKAFASVHEHLLRAEQVVKGHGGAVVKVIGAGLMAAFHEPVAAVRAALEMPAALSASELTRGLQVRFAIHRGPALTATINDRLDYFGATAALAAALPTAAGPGELVLTRAVAADGPVADLLDARELHCDVIDINLSDSRERFAHRLKLVQP
jgi:class 3 adenylate cyclase